VLLHPISTLEVVGVILIFILSGFFNATGIGGGSLFVAILISWFNYMTKTAVAISYSILLGGSLAKTIFSARLRSEKTNCPLINYDVAMILIPAMLMGSIIGQYLNQIFPSLIILIFMTMLLVAALIKIIQKAKKTKEEELALIKNQ